MNIKFTDASRDDREVSLFVWYPAVLPSDAKPIKYNLNAEPDRSAVLYPVILSLVKVGLIIGPHLAGRGFVVVGVYGSDSKDHWGTSDKSMISFIDQDHMMIFDDEKVELMKHFASAFFGYHLQRQEDYAEYFSEDLISKQEGLSMGVYSDE